MLSPNFPSPAELKEHGDRLIASASNLEDGGELTQASARETWGEAVEVFMKLARATTPFTEIGRYARMAAIIATLKSGGKGKASKLLADLIAKGDISPSLCEEMIEKIR